MRTWGGPQGQWKLSFGSFFAGVYLAANNQTNLENKLIHAEDLRKGDQHNEDELNLLNSLRMEKQHEHNLKHLRNLKCFWQRFQYFHEQLRRILLVMGVDRMV